MRIAVVGKGGVGKTTISGFLARTFAAQNYHVLAVDADPDANLASALPLDGVNAQDIVPLALKKDEIKAIVSSRGELIPGLMLLNPDVSDLVSSYTVNWGEGNQLLVMGWHKAGGQGCYCEENVVLKQLLSTVSESDYDVMIIDSEAGLEHLSRGTVRAVDAAIVVIEPGLRSVETALASKKLCADLGIEHVYIVLNGYETMEELAFMQSVLPDWPILAGFPRLNEVREADLQGQVPKLSDKVMGISQHIVSTLIVEIGG